MSEQLPRADSGLLPEPLADHHFRQIVDEAQTGAWVIDAHSRTTYVNRRMHQMLGYDAEEMLGRPLEAFMDDAARADLQHYLQRRQMGVAEQHDFRFMRRDGSAQWVAISTHPLLDAAGRYMGAAALMTDIQQRKRAEAELAAERNFVEAALDGLDDGLTVLDIHGNVLRVNAAWRDFAQVAGANAARANEGANYLDVCDRAVGEGNDDARAVAAGLRRVMAGELAAFEYEYPCPSPSAQHWFLASAQRYGSGDTARVIVKHIDVTQRRQAQAALRDRVAEYQRLFDSSLDGVLRTTSDGVVLAANPAACAVFGLSEAEICARGWAGLVDAADARLQTFRNERLASGQARGELNLVRGSGDLFEAEVFAITHRDNQGHECTSLIVRDLTEVRAAQRQRETLELQLRQAQKMEAMGTLAGGIAHDFNNILVAILGHAALAQSELSADPAAQEHVLHIGRAAERARSLVQKILAFSRRQPLSLTVQPMQPVVAEAAELLRAALPAGVGLQVDLDPAPLTVRCDRTLLQQAVMNLGLNAWQALASPHGRIQLRLARVLLDEHREADLALLPPGAYARLQVQDDGVGMDRTTQLRIFEPFFTTKATGAGTGLGLSVVHGIVADHGGVVRVDSQPGLGSTFSVLLPVVQASKEASPALTRQPVDHRGRGEHILLVDDDELVRVVTSAWLEHAGYQVTCANGGAQALDLLRAQPDLFALVVTDYNMPGCTGAELARALALLAPTLPVVVVSGYLSDEIRQSLEGTGVRRLLQKERLLEDLGENLRQVLQKGA